MFGTGFEVSLDFITSSSIRFSLPGQLSRRSSYFAPCQLWLSFGCLVRATQGFPGSKNGFQSVFQRWNWKQSWKFSAWNHRTWQKTTDSTCVFRAFLLQLLKIVDTMMIHDYPKVLSCWLGGSCGSTWGTLELVERMYAKVFDQQAIYT